MYYRFKYSTCYCSSEFRPESFLLSFDLNTAPVIVQETSGRGCCIALGHLNTAPVIVQVLCYFKNMGVVLHLNTAPVIVQIRLGLDYHP